MNGFISKEESRGMLFIKQPHAKFSYIVPYEQNQYTIRVTLKKTKLTPSYKNSKIHINMDFDLETELLYGNKKIPYDFDNKANTDVSQILTKTIKEEISQAVVQAQKKFVCDYLQFDDAFRMKFPAEFSKMDWEKEFPKITWAVNVKLKLKQSTMMDYDDYRTQ